MRKLLLILVFAASCRPQAAEDPVLSIRADDIRKHQTYLASEELEGRGPASEGARKASAYIAEQVKGWGFAAGGVDGTYFQPFSEGRRNVIGVRPGRSGKEYVVLGAHYDHLGRKGDAVFPGADDNASGTSTMLDVAEALSKSTFARTLVCIWFDGEEAQLAGSRWWAAHPTLPVADCVAMMNCDMVGRNEPGKLFCGVEKTAKGEPKYPKWAALLKEAETAWGAPFDWTEFDPYIKRSDHWPFMEQGVPAMFFTAGLHADYHKEGDRIEKINFAKEERVGRLVYGVAVKLLDGAGSLK